MLTASSLASLLLLFSLTVFFLARNVLHFQLAQLQTLVFVMLVFSGQGVVYLVRERRHFWHSRPSRLLLLSTGIDIAIVSMMAVRGVLMTALPWWSLAELHGPPAWRSLFSRVTFLCGLSQARSLRVSQ